MFAGMASKEVPGSADHGLLPMVLWSHSVCIIFFDRRLVVNDPSAWRLKLDIGLFAILYSVSICQTLSFLSIPNKNLYQMWKLYLWHLPKKKKKNYTCGCHKLHLTCVGNCCNCAP
jgi:hypothetical protein